MINKEMARNFVRNAEIILEEAVHMSKLKYFHRVVRLCQESFELSMKACLRAVGIEHPKEHDVSDALIENRDRFPKWFKDYIDSLSEASIWLVEKRGPSMYGDEIKGVPAMQLFNEEDAEKALRLANNALAMAKRLFSELFQEKI